MPESVLAAIATALCALALKFFDSWLAKRKEKRDQKAKDKEAADQEARIEVEELKVKMHALESKFDLAEQEIELWKEKYWKLREDYVLELSKLVQEFNDKS